MFNYSDCNWKASGEFECDQQGQFGGGAQQTPQPYQGGFSPDNYSSLSREMEVSVYATRPSMSPRMGDQFPSMTPFSPVVPPSPLTMGMGMGMGMGPQQPRGQEPPIVDIQWSRSPEKPAKKFNPYFFQTPYQKYHELVVELGEPNTIDRRAGGLAIWHKSSLGKHPVYRIFSRIEIVDEQCFNKFPVEHIGFLYTYFKCGIPLSILNNVLSISGDIFYDIKKKTLIVRGMSLGYNMALCALIVKYVNGDVSWYQITEEDLVRKAMTPKRLTNPKIQKLNQTTLMDFAKEGK
jgi:hypothetical protein